MSKVIKVDFKGVPSDLTADMVEPKDVNWLWWPRIAAATITLIGARGATGKGMMLTDLAARITRGDRWPLVKARAPQGKVLWCETEDLIAETVIPRLIAAEADRSQVILMTKPAEFFALDLKSYIKSRDIRLIVLSPFNSFLQGLDDANHGLHVRNKLEKLQNAIEKTNCALVGICHLNKKADLDAIERLLGSVEYVNFARNVLLLHSEDESTVRVVHAKPNIAKKGKDLLFTKVNTRPQDSRSAYWGIEWSVPESNVDQDRLFDRKQPDEDHKSAGAWLVKYLDDCKWHDLDEIVRAAEPYAHTKSALQRAQQRSNGSIESERVGFGPQQTTRWRLKK